MSKNKSKLRWKYVTEPFNVYVDPKQVKRVHAPLKKSLTFEPEYQGYCLHLRTCERGVDEYGATVKYLYCTYDGRFFARGEDGWNEQKINHTPNCPSLKDRRSHSAYPIMRNFGGKYCHLCIVYAWHGARPEGMVCDHLDTNLLNLNATNFEWVTVPENFRRRGIARRMRQIGLDPKLLTPTLCKGIYSLNQYQLDVFFNALLYFCNQDPSPLSIDAIRLDVANALDTVKEQPNPNF